MQRDFNRGKWRLALDDVMDNITPGDYAEMVNKEKSSVSHYNSSNITLNAFYSTIKNHRQDLAELTINELLDNDIDVGMMNYLVTKLDYEALVIYSALVDMTDFDPDDDGYHVNQFVAQGKRDCVLLCIKKGLESNPAGFFKLAASTGHFDDARYYANEMNAKFTKASWDSMFKKIGYYESWSKVEEVFNFIEEMDLGHPMAGYNTNKIIGELLSNGRTEAAEFIYSRSDKVIDAKDGNKLMKDSLTYESSIRWLMSKGVPLGKEMPRILSQMSHGEGTEEFILDILKDADPKKVPWVKMLEGAIGAGPKNDKGKIKFFTDLHYYSEKEISTAYKRVIDYQNIKLSNLLENEHGLVPDMEDLRYAIIDPKYSTSSKLTLELIKRDNMDIGINNNELLYTACLNVYQRGGPADVISALLENGADPYGHDGEIIELLSKGNRKDIETIFNRYLSKEDRFGSNKVQDMTL